MILWWVVETADALTNRNSYLSLRPIQAEVPQGSLFESTLFKIYINDIPSVENDCNVAISVYADDTNINVRSGSIHSVSRMR
jgi:hypothetical protein